MESFEVQAILSAIDKGFTDVMRQAQKSTEEFEQKQKKAGVSFGSILKGVGVYKAIDLGINAVTGSLGGAIERYDKLSQFPKVLEGLGASTSDAANATDILKKGIDGLPTKLQDVAGTTQQMFAVFKDGKTAANSTIALNNALLASGSSGDKAAQGTEQYLKILRTGKVDMDSYTTLQATMGVGLDKLATKFGFTGATAQNDLYKALQSGQITVDQFNQGLIDIQDGLGGTAEIAKKSTEGIGTSIGNLKTAITNGLANTLAVLDKTLKDKGFGGFAGMADKLKAKINELFAAFNAALPSIIDKVATAFKFLADNGDWLIPVLAGVASGFVALGAINSVMKTIDSVKNTITGVSAAFTFLTSPVGLVVLAIGAVVAAGILLYKNWDTVKEVASNVWNSVKDIIGGVSDWITDKWEGAKSFFSGIWDGIKELTSNTWKAVKYEVINTWESITDTLKGAWDGIKGAWDNTITFFSDLWNGVKQTTTDVWDSVIEFVSDVVSKLLAPFPPIGEMISSIFSAVVESVKTIFSNLITITTSVFEILKNIILAPILFITSLISGGWNEAVDNMKTVWGNLVESFTTNWESIKTIFVTYITTIVNVLSAAWIGIQETIVNVWNAILQGITTTWTIITETLTNVWNAIVDLAKTTWQGFADFMSGLWEGIKTTISTSITQTKEDAVNIWNSLIEWAKTTWQGFKDFLSGICTGIVDSATQAWENLKQGVSNTIQSVKNIFNALKEIDLLEIGKNIIDGLVNGISNGIQKVKDVVKDVASTITGGLKSFLHIKSPSRVMKSLGGFTAEGLAIGIADGARGVSKASDLLAQAAQPDLNMSASLADMNGSLNSTIQHEFNMSGSKKSATFNIRLGNQQFSAFVDDISQAMGQDSEINLVF